MQMGIEFWQKVLWNAEVIFCLYFTASEFVVKLINEKIKKKAFFVVVFAQLEFKFKFELWNKIEFISFQDNIIIKRTKMTFLL